VHHPGALQPPPCTFALSLLWQIPRSSDASLAAVAWSRLDERSFAFDPAVPAEAAALPRTAAEAGTAPAAVSNVLLSGFFQSFRHRPRPASAPSAPPYTRGLSARAARSRYFAHHRARLRAVLSLPPHRERAARARLREILCPRARARLGPPEAREWRCSPEGARVPGEVVAVHVRRTDYAEYAKTHPLLGEAYYRDAAEVVRAAAAASPADLSGTLERALSRGEDPPIVFLVFCDDEDWCRAQRWVSELAGAGGRVEVVGGVPDVIALRLMALCKHLIIANSSFSWWAAYLSARRAPNAAVLLAAAPGEPGWDEEQETGATGARGEGEDEGVLGQDKGLVVAPAQWFGPQGPQWEPNDLFPPDWVVL